MHHADTNRNGFVDDAEIENLVAFARKELGLRMLLAICRGLMYRMLVMWKKRTELMMSNYI